LQLPLPTHGVAVLAQLYASMSRVDVSIVPSAYMTAMTLPLEYVSGPPAGASKQARVTSCPLPEFRGKVSVTSPDIPMQRYCVRPLAVVMVVGNGIVRTAMPSSGLNSEMKKGIARFAATAAVPSPMRATSKLFGWKTPTIVGVAEGDGGDGAGVELTLAADDAPGDGDSGAGAYAALKGGSETPWNHVSGGATASCVSTASAVA